jgi:hypothetical protein
MGLDEVSGEGVEERRVELQALSPDVRSVR